ncbi:MAG: hypothetical protein GY761_09755 [Hyphomicrobiales bacterium]|nr:hypothetical protein [Hyphomicrobiales bacterium]
MRQKQRNPITANDRASKSIKTLGSAIDTKQLKSASNEIQAVSFSGDGETMKLPAIIIAKRHRLSFPVAKLICTLNNIGGRT